MVPSKVCQERMPHVLGRWQLGYDEDQKSWCAIHGATVQETEVERTIKRAELWAFLMSLQCLDLEKMRTCGQNVYERINGIIEFEWSLDVKHDQVHRTKKEKKATTEEQHFIVEGNEKAD